MSSSHRTLRVATALLLVGILAAGVWWWMLRSDGAAEAAGVDASADEVSAPQAVTGVEVVRDTLWITVNASGRAAAVRHATVNARIQGEIREIGVRENDRVGAGDVLVRFDTAELALALSQARVELQNAQAEFQRITLFDDEIEDPRVREQREASARVSSGVAAAEVRVRQEELQLERATVAAPFEGRIADLRVVAGQHVGAGTELLTVVDLDPIKVEVSVLEAELGYLGEGRRATLAFTAFPGETFDGRIETLNPMVGDQRTGRVTVQLPNPGGRIKPGMYAEVSLDARYHPDRLLVPRSAILERDGRTILYVYEAEGEDRGLASIRHVATGEQNDGFVAVLPGPTGDTVEPGEIVLVDGHHFIADGTEIRLVDNPAVQGPPSRR